MRRVNPDDLEQLAKLLDGRGSVQDKIDEAFARASRLGVSGKLTALKPLRSWVADTAPDLRRRAGIARLESGDPEAGVRWAGFSAEDIRQYKGQGLSPDQLLLANSVAASDVPATKSLRRRGDESIDAWIERLESTALTKIPGLEPHKETVEAFVGAVREYKGFTETAAQTTLIATSLTKVLVGNRIRAAWRAGGWTQPIQDSVYNLVRRSGDRGLVRWGRHVRAWYPELRSLNSPGSWLPTKIANVVYRSRGFQHLGSLPGMSTVQTWASSRGWNRLAGSRFMDMGPNSIVRFIGGSNELAREFGGITHAGVAARAASANLLKVTGNAYTEARAVQGLGRGASVFRGLAATGKVAGAFRGAGVVSGVASTAISANTVYHDGLPWDNGNFSTREKGASYVADVAETGFNASLTAATVAPNPVTIGATAVFGAVYLGAKVVQHWDGVKEGADKAVDAVADTAKEAVTNPVGTAKKVGHAINPKNWF
ncbi:PE-PGRS family protein [Streptomyces sp. NBC_01089]|uniref:PE-PGRS family protein n=1 Tax=Streptomyces sp. NBC_01089 TaxID=2903747 RepID=UPI00386A2780|nr:PE-PGRS family protein [Streptomyces sp. NBC_01089]